MKLFYIYKNYKKRVAAFKRGEILGQLFGKKLFKLKISRVKSFRRARWISSLKSRLYFRKRYALTLAKNYWQPKRKLWRKAHLDFIFIKKHKSYICKSSVYGFLINYRWYTTNYFNNTPGLLLTKLGYKPFSLQSLARLGLKSVLNNSIGVSLNPSSLWISPQTYVKTTALLQNKLLQVNSRRVQITYKPIMGLSSAFPNIKKLRALSKKSKSKFLKVKWRYKRPYFFFKEFRKYGLRLKSRGRDDLPSLDQLKDLIWSNVINSRLLFNLKLASGRGQFLRKKFKYSDPKDRLVSKLRKQSNFKRKFALQYGHNKKRGLPTKHTLFTKRLQYIKLTNSDWRSRFVHVVKGSVNTSTKFKVNPYRRLLHRLKGRWLGINRIRLTNKFIKFRSVCFNRFPGDTLYIERRRKDDRLNPFFLQIRNTTELRYNCGLKYLRRNYKQHLKSGGFTTPGKAFLKEKLRYTFKTKLRYSINKRQFREWQVKNRVFKMFYLSKNRFKSYMSNKKKFFNELGRFKPRLRLYLITMDEQRQRFKTKYRCSFTQAPWCNLPNRNKFNFVQNFLRNKTSWSYSLLRYWEEKNLVIFDTTSIVNLAATLNKKRVSFSDSQLSEHNDLFIFKEVPLDKKRNNKNRVVRFKGSRGRWRKGKPFLRLLRRNIKPNPSRSAVKKFWFSRFKRSTLKTTRFKYHKFRFNRFFRFVKFKDNLNFNFYSGSVKTNQLSIRKQGRWSPAYASKLFKLLWRCSPSKLGVSTTKWGRNKKWRYVKNKRRAVYLKRKRAQRKTWQSNWLLNSNLSGKKLRNPLTTTRPKGRSIKLDVRHLNTYKLINKPLLFVKKQAVVDLKTSKTLKPNFLVDKLSELNFKFNSRNYKFVTGKYKMERLNFFKTNHLKVWQKDRFKVINRYTPETTLKKRFGLLSGKPGTRDFEETTKLKLKLGTTLNSEANLKIRAGVRKGSAKFLKGRRRYKPRKNQIGVFYRFNSFFKKKNIRDLIDNLGSNTVTTLFNKITVGLKFNLVKVNYGGYVAEKHSASPKIFSQTLVGFLERLVSDLKKPSRTEFKPVYGKYASSYLLSFVKKFFEFSFNYPITLFINFELLRRISNVEVVFLNRMKLLLRVFNYKFSTIFFLNEFLDIMYIVFKMKNFNILTAYINKILKNLIIWDHKAFFRFFFDVIREHMFTLFDTLKIFGLKIIIKGKVGVGGNSRKRWITLKLGKTTSTYFNTNAHTVNTWLNTRTGALGFRVILYYGTLTN